MENEYLRACFCNAFGFDCHILHTLYILPTTTSIKQQKTTTMMMSFRLTQLLLCLQLVISRIYASQSKNIRRIRELEYEDIKRQENIVGAEEANATEYPSFVLFANGECGGTLISKDRVLTAAHCVYSGHPDTVRIGASNRTDGKEVKVRCAKSHPLYVWPKFQYDIAVLKLEEEITDIDFPMLNTITDYPSDAGQELIVLGMGRNATVGTPAQNLMELNYSFVPDQQCKEVYGTQVTNGLHVCAEGFLEGSK